MDKLIISADTTDEGASKVVSGNENLQMGENRVTLKVTAQDGETTKEYVIVVPSRKAVQMKVHRMELVKKALNSSR